MVFVFVILELDNNSSHMLCFMDERKLDMNLKQHKGEQMMNFQKTPRLWTRDEWPSFSSPEQSLLPASSSRPLRADARCWHGGWKGWWRAGRCSPYCHTGSPDTAAGGSSHSSREQWSPAAHACTASTARPGGQPRVEDWVQTYTNKRVVYYNPVMWA